VTWAALALALSVLLWATLATFRAPHVRLLSHEVVNSGNEFATVKVRPWGWPFWRPVMLYGSSGGGWWDEHTGKSMSRAVDDKLQVLLDASRARYAQLNDGLFPGEEAPSQEQERRHARLGEQRRREMSEQQRKLEEDMRKPHGMSWDRLEYMRQRGDR